MKRAITKNLPAQRDCPHCRHGSSMNIIFVNRAGIEVKALHQAEQSIWRCKDCGRRTEHQ